MKKLIIALTVMFTCLSLFAAAAPETSDLAYVQGKGTLVVGITDFEPMDYKDANGNWIGFDADMANAFAQYIGVKAKFIEIDWDNKLTELNIKNIDCIWNGMTIDDGIKASMETAKPYMNNAQVVVLAKAVADQYTTVDAVKSLKFAVENGSAGAKQLEDLGIKYVGMQTQADALLEVASGTSDACVIDLMMAAAMIGEGTSYPNLTYTVKLNSEEYGVGFRKGSDLAEKLNQFMAEYYKSGKTVEIGKVYKVQEALIEQ